LKKYNLSLFFILNKLFISFLSLSSLKNIISFFILLFSKKFRKILDRKGKTRSFVQFFLWSSQIFIPNSPSTNKEEKFDLKKTSCIEHLTSYQKSNISNKTERFKVELKINSKTKECTK
jgi:hypothetical protein